jgi:hypothetical protein
MIMDVNDMKTHAEALWGLSKPYRFDGQTAELLTKGRIRKERFSWFTPS